MRGCRGECFFIGSQAAGIEGRLIKRLEDEMRVRGSTLRRSRTNRIIGGVCGGLEEFFGLDAFWFRLGFVLALLPGGVPGIAIYLVMWLIMPSE
jgi:phage shock protein PspC (stress-responsive transcriptional regulator)